MAIKMHQNTLPVIVGPRLQGMMQLIPRSPRQQFASTLLRIEILMKHRENVTTGLIILLPGGEMAVQVIFEI